MKPHCRIPRGVRRLLRRYPRASGLVVYGWYRHIYLWRDYARWQMVSVRIDGGKSLAQLDFRVRGPIWFDVAPGSHVVTFGGFKGKLKDIPLEFGPNTVHIVTFRPPFWVAGRPERDGEWCSTRLRR